MPAKAPGADVIAQNDAASQPALNKLMQITSWSEAYPAAPEPLSEEGQLFEKTPGLCLYRMARTVGQVPWRRAGLSQSFVDPTSSTSLNPFAWASFAKSGWTMLTPVSSITSEPRLPSATLSRN